MTVTRKLIALIPLVIMNVTVDMVMQQLQWEKDWFLNYSIIFNFENLKISDF